MKKVFVFFIIIFVAIFVVHILYNIEIITKLPSSKWSRDKTIHQTLFNRKPLVSFTKDDNVLLVSPYEKGDGRLVISLYNDNIELLDENLVNIKELNFNLISIDEIFLDENRIYWRDKSTNKAYIGKISNDYSKLEIEKVFDDINYLNHIKNGDISYITIIDSEDTICIIKIGDDIEDIIEGPKGIDNITSFKLSVNDNDMYLLLEQKDTTTGFKNILISEYSNGKWILPQKVNQINETRVNIKSSDIICDGEKVYSIISIQGDDKSRFIYIINGLDLKSHQLIENLKLEHGFDFKIGYFSSTPMILGPIDSGFEIVTTAPTNIDLYSRNASNVVKVSIDEGGIKNGELLSKTKSWSNRPCYISKDNEYVFWNEPEKGKYNKVKVATTNKSLVDQSNKISSDVIKEAIGEEIPVIISYNFLYSIGGRFISILPALFWLMYMFVNNEKLHNKWNKLFLIGIAIFYIFQLLTIKDIYYPNTLIYMPKFLKNKGSKIIYPTIFTFIGWYAARLWGKGKETKEGYKLYMTFIVFSYLLMNYLYSPYIFK